MKADEPRAIQSPLKELYRQHPAAAFVTLKAKGHLGVFTRKMLLMK